MDKLFHENAKNFKSIVDGKVNLTVTSPPYANAINYDKHKSGDNYKDREDLELENFLDNQKEIFQEVYDSTEEGGYCAIVIGMTKKDTEEGGIKVPLPHHFATMMEDIGWKFKESITWSKVTGGVRVFGVTIQNPYPGYYYPNQMTEEIQIWRKGEPKREKVEGNEINVESDFVKKEIANNIWHIAPEPPGKYTEQHPCPFPEEIVHRLIELYTNKGDLIADPMAGIGTTLKVAKHLDRKYVGTELSEEYVETARKRIKNEEYERRDQLVPEFNKLDPEE